MNSQTPPETPTDDLFRHRLENLIDTRHELVKLSELIDWEHFEVQWGATFRENGRPGIATRLIAGLHYLKHTYALSDEQVDIVGRRTRTGNSFAVRPTFNTSCRWIRVP